MFDTGITGITGEVAYVVSDAVGTTGDITCAAVSDADVDAGTTAVGTCAVVPNTDTTADGACACACIACSTGGVICVVLSTTVIDVDTSGDDICAVACDTGKCDAGAEAVTIEDDMYAVASASGTVEHGNCAAVSAIMPDGETTLDGDAATGTADGTTGDCICSGGLDTETFVEATCAVPSTTAAVVDTTGDGACAGV